MTARRLRIGLGAAAVALALLSTQLPWARAEAACANTGAELQFGAGPTAAGWAALFLAGIAVTQIAGLIPGAGVRYVGLGAGVVALVAVVWGLGIDNRTAFEAFRPTSSGGAVGVLCHFDPAAGYWTALASCVLTLGAGLAVLRTGGPAWR